MKILYDHQIFDNQVHGGISRYFYNLMDQFYKNKSVDFKFSSMYSHNNYLKTSEFKKVLSFLEDKKFKGKDRLLNFFLNLNKFNSIFNLKKQSFDIFHPTEYGTYFLDYIQDKPFVLTVYDMIHEIYNKDCIDYINRKKLLIQKATKVIAISENTKQDILKFVDVPEHKVEVIHLASSFNNKKLEHVLLPKKFLLFIGNRGGYKNFDFFLDSIKNFLKKDEKLFLVCVGGGYFIKSEIEFINQNNLAGKVLHFNLTDHQLSYAYSKALAFVLPSLYEGFGIPILEAFSCGCLVLLANKSCFPEVAQDAAIYFDPQNSASILQATEKVLIDKKLRSEKIEKGFKRLRDFSWQKMALQTEQVYKSIL
jgi:glycosyltransferase involved in cell wall biosynthesis